MWKVAITDDHPLLLEGLKNILGNNTISSTFSTIAIPSIIPAISLNLNFNLSRSFMTLEHVLAGIYKTARLKGWCAATRIARRKHNDEILNEDSLSQDEDRLLYKLFTPLVDIFGLQLFYE